MVRKAAEKDGSARARRLGAAFLGAAMLTMPGGLRAQSALKQLQSEPGAAAGAAETSSAKVEPAPAGAPAAAQGGGASSSSAGARKASSTGSVKLSRAEYPVPGKVALAGDVMIHIRVNDRDWSPYGQIASGKTGPITFKVVHDGQERVIYTAGGQAPDGIELGPMREIEPDAGIFQADVALSEALRIQAGDTLVVEYLDPADAGGSPSLSKDSADFVMFDAILQSDKPEYQRGREAILTLVDPALNRDSEVSEKVSLKAVHFMTDGIDVTLDNPAFDPRNMGEGAFIETGRDTGIFQAVVTIPGEINGKWIPPGAAIKFAYNDVSPRGARVPGELARTVELPVSLSRSYDNIISFDSASYAAYVIVTITLKAPDTAGYGIAGAGRGTVTITAGNEKLSGYALAETGRNTGMFVGEVQLSSELATGGVGPRQGILRVASGDDLMVSYDCGGPNSYKIADHATIR